MQSHKELIVWQRAMELVREIYALSVKFPKEEQFGLTAQMRRASVSIPSNIAEGYVRKNRKEYIQFIMISFGSAAELETQLEIAQMLHYVSEEESKRAGGLLTEVLKMLNALQKKLRSK